MAPAAQSLVVEVRYQIVIRKLHTEVWAIVDDVLKSNQSEQLLGVYIVDEVDTQIHKRVRGKMENNRERINNSSSRTCLRRRKVKSSSAEIN